MFNQYNGHLLPGVFLKGVGLEVLWRDTLGLVIIGAALLSASVPRLHRPPRKPNLTRRSEP